MIRFEEPTTSNNYEFTMFKDGKEIDTYKVSGYCKKEDFFYIQIRNPSLFIDKFEYRDFIITVIDDNGDFREVECYLDEIYSRIFKEIRFRAKDGNYFILPEISEEEEEIQELKEEIESLKEERDAFKQDANSYKEALEIYRKEIISLKKELEEVNPYLQARKLRDLEKENIKLKILNRKKLEDIRKTLNEILGD